jgi:hypothetical protein
LGFPKVIHEEGYVMYRDPVPYHGALVTNPPFSGDNIERILRFAAEGNKGRPFFILIPQYVATKAYFLSWKWRGRNQILFAGPQSEAYVFEAPASLPSRAAAAAQEAAATKLSNACKLR